MAYAEEAEAIVESINRASYDAWIHAEEAGFHEIHRSFGLKGNIYAKLALIHTEVSEATEELRDAQSIRDIAEVRYEGETKPVGLLSELADILIRVFDLAEEIEQIHMEEYEEEPPRFSLGDVLIQKMVYNKTRPRLHGRSD